MERIENAVTLRFEERKKAFIAFRNLYHQLDKAIAVLYQSKEYTVFEFEKLARHYHVLQWRADRMEEKLRQNFPSSDLEEAFKWLKYSISPQDEKEEKDADYSHWFRTLEEEDYMNAICNEPGYEIEDYPEPDFLELDDYEIFEYCDDEYNML